MTRIPGASQYLNQATLANKSGINYGNSNVLADGPAGTATLLDVGRLNGVRGMGLSASARSYNKAFLQSTSSTYNQLFSLSGGGSVSEYATRIQIAGLAATVPSSRDVPLDVRDGGERGDIVDEQA